MPAGRPRVDIKRQLEKKRLSRADQAARAPDPVRLNEGRICMPSVVKADPVARAKWKELKKLFEGKDYNRAFRCRRDLPLLLSVFGRGRPP